MRIAYRNINLDCKKRTLRMFIYQSKSEECVKLLAEKGIADYGYGNVCTISMGEFIVGFIMLGAIVMSLAFPIVMLFVERNRKGE